MTAMRSRPGSATALRVLIVIWVAACGSPAPEPASAALMLSAPEPKASAIDFTQAEHMLALLDARPPTPSQVDTVLAARGTALIVGQLNLSRHVTEAQYRAVVAALGDAAAPEIAPADESERAKRGVAGLHDVWQVLRWGAANTVLLADRISALRGHDLASAARALVVEWLPEPRAPDTRLFVVMGGRAGAAAIRQDIYFDVLATSFKASLGVMTYPTPTEIAEFFAHEMHHVALAPLVDQRRPALSSSEEARRAYDLLAMLVTEGTATFLINAHQDLAIMRRDLQYAEHLADPAALLTTIVQLLDDVTAGRLGGEAYERAITPLVASGFHSAGALMIDAIYRTAGRAGVFDVMRDPRHLPAAFNAAAAELGRKGEKLSPFSPTLAERLARLE
jgi:hypothetical protein